MMAKLFRYVGGTLEWADMGEVYDRIRFGDEIFDFVRGREAWTDKMKPISRIKPTPKRSTITSNWFECSKGSSTYLESPASHGCEGRWRLYA